MIINTIACESLNSQLNLLSKGGFDGFSSEELNSESVTDKYLLVCNALVNELLNPLQPLCLSSIAEIYHALNTALPFQLNSDGIKYKLLHFLSTAVQSERLRILNEAKQNPSNERGRLVFQLDKICKVLNIQTTNLENECDVIDLIHHTVSTLFDKSDNVETLKNPSKILAHIRTLNEEQIRITNKINEAFYEDFQLRRQMLLKRLDVTIQSFLWSQKAGFDETEIKKAINAQLQYLCEKPKLFTVQDALSAPFALIHEHAKKVTGSVASASGNKSIVKQIIIGKVPDRGGRANEMRPKHFEISGFKGGSKNNQYNKNKNKNDSGNNKADATTNNANNTSSSSSGDKGGNQQQANKEKFKNENKNNQKEKKDNKAPGNDATAAPPAAPPSNQKQKQQNNQNNNNNNNSSNKSGRVVVLEDVKMEVVSQSSVVMNEASGDSAENSKQGGGQRKHHYHNRNNNKKARTNS